MAMPCTQLLAWLLMAEPASETCHFTAAGCRASDDEKDCDKHAARKYIHHHHHHHQITQSSHSINAMGPAPHRGGRKREHSSVIFATITHIPSLHKIRRNAPRYHSANTPATPSITSNNLVDASNNASTLPVRVLLGADAQRDIVVCAAAATL
jgi:hypothetical protein